VSAPVLATLGAGALAGWIALPVLARLAGRAGDEPVARQRLLVTALAGGWLLIAAPWLRLVTDTGFLVSASEAHAVLGGIAPLIIDTGPSLVLVGLGVVWLALAALGLSRTASGLVSLAALCRRAEPAPATLIERAQRIAASLGVAAPPVLLSTEAVVPFVAGAFRPRIVLPRALAQTLEPAALELVLRHELLHVLRADPARALAIALLRVAFTGHPSARWLAAEIALAREAAIDAQIAAGETRTYATLLVDVAAHAAGRAEPAELVGMTTSALARRIDWMLCPPPARGGRGLALLCALVLAVVGVLVAPRAAVGLPPPPVVESPVVDECWSEEVDCAPAFEEETLDCAGVCE